MTQLDRLPAHDRDGHVRVVVEAPRGSRVKLKYDPELAAFTLGRPLSLGLHYPFDWGFVPGTRAPDGDPIDALVLHDVPTHPGVVIPCALLGVVKVKEKKRGKIQRNDRLIAVPVEAPRFDGLRNGTDLPTRVKREIERFFLTVVYFTPKEVEIIGWGSLREATRLLAATIDG